MKKKLFILCITICIGYGIICPDLLAKSAANGLYLWYHSVLPTLLPFGILSGIILRTGMYDAILERISPFLKGIYPLRPPLFYPLIAGYLFGFPLGSKLCADLYDLGKISKNEAVRVSCISNNFGPAFVVNYVLAALPEGVMPDWMFLAIGYGTPLLLGWFMLWGAPENPPEKNSEKMPASRSEITLKIIDDGIMNGFTTMIKLAGYIMLFSIAADFAGHLPLPGTALSGCVIGLLEITNGIYTVSGTEWPAEIKYLSAMAMVSFGGISGICQTASMLAKLQSSIRTYVIFKLLNAMLATLFTAALVCYLNHQ